ncbi:MAG: sigma-70 family RNA polymerase sigma factor [Candidatus Riflebacteria bacterium]|nr:sigma-70 family RNA polymerase sigma factor [Candidatus Riflebacteria bacterium]
MSFSKGQGLQLLMIPSSSSDPKIINSNEEDRLTIEKVIKGQKAAFSILFSKYQRLVRINIWNFFRKKDLVDDLCQEAFEKAFLALESLKNPEKFKSWILQITYRLCVDYQRSNVGQEKTQAILQNSIEKNVSLDLSNLFKEESILYLLEQLSQIDGLIVCLRYIEDFEYQEISEILGISEPTIRQKASRAIRQLRSCLK